jgi:trans-aconitate methyltransferase
MTDREASGWNDLDTETPNPARMYDYLLGGAANFAADRAAVQQILEVNPHARAQARANRAFMRRAVRYLAVEQGVRQFLDLGSGIPTVGNVHEIVRQSAPEARVVYVDSEAVAANYGRRALADVPGAEMVRADIRDVDAVLSGTGKLLDFGAPVAVLMFAVLHFVLDDQEVRDLLAAYRDRTVPSSWLALSHVCADENPTMAAVQENYRSTSIPGRVRTRAEIEHLFDGYRLVIPGVVNVQDWRPDEHDDSVRPGILCGVASHS